MSILRNRRPTSTAPTAHLSSPAWSGSPLYVFTAAMASLTVLFALGMLIDPRPIQGHPAWLKPLKFGISITIYTATTAWMLGFLNDAGRWIGRFRAAFVWSTIIVFSVEMLAIVTQVVRGTTSHFNVATSFDAGVWAVMAVAISVLWFANFLLAGVLLFRRFVDPVVAWSVRLGVIIAVAGMSQAFLMTSPTAQQMAGWQAGGEVSIVGAHSVGAPDGGDGIPVTGWRSDAGDLRVGHFVGLHGLQAIPLFGWWIGRRRRLDQRRKVALVFVAAGAYVGATALVTWQALRAQPLLQPDALTLSFAAGLAAATALAAVWILARPGTGKTIGSGRSRTASAASRVGSRMQESPGRT